VEIDFVVETAHKRPESKQRIVAIEVKRSEKWEQVVGKTDEEPRRKQ